MSLNDNAAYAGEVIERHGGIAQHDSALLGDRDLMLIVDLPDAPAAVNASMGLAKLTGISFATSSRWKWPRSMHGRRGVTARLPTGPPCGSSRKRPIAALRGEVDALELSIGTLIAEMEAAIAEATDFIQAMGGG